MRLIFYINYYQLIHKFARLHKAFANGSLAGIKSSKAQLPKMLQLGGFLDRLLGPLLKTDLPLMKSVLKPSAKSVLFL